MRARRLLSAAVLVAFGGCSGCDDEVVTVDVVGESGLPVSGVIVLFSDADGAVSETTSTNERGRARHALERGGSVTVAFEFGGKRTLATRLAIAPGDELLFRLEDAVDEPDVTAGRLVLTPPPNPPTADEFAFFFGCQEAIIYESFTLVQPLYERCRDDATGLVDVALVLSSGGVPVAFSIDENEEIDATQDHAVNFPDGYRSDFHVVDLVARNPPRWAVSGQFGFVPYRRANPTRYPTPSDLPLVPGQEQSASFSLPRGFFAATEISFFVSGDPTVPHPTGFFSETVAPIPEDETIDLTERLFPGFVDAFAIDGSGESPVATFGVQGSLAEADFGMVRSFWTDPGYEYVWDVVFPSAHVGPIVFPRLPDELASFRPLPGESDLGGFVGFMDLGSLEGFADAKHDPSLPLPGETYVMRYASFAEPLPE